MKTLVSYSGGMDSTALLLSLIADKHEVECINFYYGSKHNASERARAEQITKELGVKLTEIDMDFINRLFKSDLLQSGGAVPEGHYAEENMKKTVVPFRNGIMLSIATGYAESIDANQVAIANHAGDVFCYPDCRQEFITPMAEAMVHGTFDGIRLYAPFTYITKSQVAKIGCDLNYGVMMNSWSCYAPHTTTDERKIHCGRCGTCTERIEAFILAGIEDTTIYADKDFAVKLLKEKGSI